MALIWGLLEEIGWRGFLTPKLSVFISPIAASLAVGVLWGLWHAPQIFINDQIKKTYSGRVIEGAILWTLACIFLGGVLGWLQFRTGSFIYPTIAHALVNVLGSVSDSSFGELRNGRLAGTGGLPAVITTAILTLILFSQTGLRGVA